MNIIITSQSSIKVSVVEQFFNQIHPNIIYNFEKISTSKAPLPEQPINSGKTCCEMRIDFAKQQGLPEKYEFIVSIENEICTDLKHLNKCCDICWVALEDNKGNRISAKSFSIAVNHEYLENAKKETPENYEYKDLGLIKTVGDMIHKKHKHISPKNWMADPMFGHVDRNGQISDALERCYNLYNLKNKVLYFNDFPKKGVLFQDLSEILCDNSSLSSMIYMMEDKIRLEGLEFDKIVGLDARGFIFGPPLALKTNTGFVMVRKKGKLPGNNDDKVSISYGTEYSASTIEILKTTINKGDRILIVDDLVATGGSLWAAKNLAEKCGAKVIGCLTVVAVEDLLEMATEKLGDTPIHVVM